MSKAANRKDTADLLKEQKKNNKKFYAEIRQQKSGVVNNQYGNPTMNNPGGFSVSGGNTNIDISFGNPLQGGNFVGPIAFNEVEKTISGGKLTIAGYFETPTSYVIVNGESGAADDLTYIISKNVDILGNASGDKGTVFIGQLLFLQAGDANITLKHNTGNIFIPGGTDLVLNKYDSTANTGGAYAILLWDENNVGTSSGKWVLVASGASTSSSSGATRELDNLQNTAVNADIIPASASSVDLGSLTKPYDRTYSDEVVFVTEGAISTNKPTIGWGNSTRGMTFSMHNLGSTQNAWTWEENGTTKMTLTNGGLLTVGTMLSTSLLRAEGDTELGNATSDDLTITARVDSDIIPKTTQSHDLGDTDRWWDKTYSMYVYTNRVTLSGSNAQIDMGNYPINNCGDIDFDGTEDIKRSGTTMLTFGSSAITTGDYKDLVLGSAAYLQVSATSSTAPSGAFDGFFYVKNTSGSFVKVPYYTP